MISCKVRGKIKYFYVTVRGFRNFHTFGSAGSSNIAVPFVELRLSAEMPVSDFHFSAYSFLLAFLQLYCGMHREIYQCKNDNASNRLSYNEFVLQK